MSSKKKGKRNKPVQQGGTAGDFGGMPDFGFPGMGMPGMDPRMLQQAEEEARRMQEMQAKAAQAQAQAEGPRYDTSKWITIYPQYLDSLKTVAEGRRIAKERACEKPTVQDISEVLKFLKIYHAVEVKAYPRDWINPGRVKVKLFDDNRHPVHPEITNKKQLLHELADKIPKLKSREERLKNAQSSQKSSTPLPAPATTSSTNKKKGKKKR